MQADYTAKPTPRYKQYLPEGLHEVHLAVSSSQSIQDPVLYLSANFATGHGSSVSDRQDVWAVPLPVRLRWSAGNKVSSLGRDDIAENGPHWILSSQQAYDQWSSRMAKEGKKVGRRHKTTGYQKATHFDFGSDPYRYIAIQCMCSPGSDPYRYIATQCMCSPGTAITLLLLTSLVCSLRPVPASRAVSQAPAPNLPQTNRYLWIAASPMYSAQETTTLPPASQRITSSPSSRWTLGRAVVRPRPLLVCPVQPGRGTRTSIRGEEEDQSHWLVSRSLE